MSLRVLVTNDDGVTAPGLARLAGEAVDRGLDVVVAAPLEEASGASAAMTAVEHEGHVVVREQPLPELPDVPVYGVAGSPGFVVLIAVRGAFGPPPSVLLAGVNRGANVGRAVLHSGTVGAAFTAAANGCRAMAVSLDVPPSAGAVAGGPAGNPAMRVRDVGRHWSTAARVALDLLPRLTGGPVESVLNVNAPDLPYERLRGVRRAALASFGQAQMTVAETGHGYLRTALTAPEQVVQPGTDLFWLAEGYASATAIRAVTEVSDVDLSGLSGEAWRPT
ncbi:5'/3'-nucleotidase SurE [Micromonospora sp. WMMD882]|uniref:5'/3'-nucleotidase SurE n=1 Tax=Micromonospora sp. WMMD882 TaxID=3015151 RepID=UPI00248B862F|nr:5'/3'-nucleotidase SurE [Micromonospora sp. WMMD882]WBB79786.1 5'/3'-nucleotidase SurE [Micromonospora sp. WMMD882]